MAWTTTALALAAALVWPLIGPDAEPVRPGVVLAARAPTDAALASPFGPAPAVMPAMAPAAAPIPAAAERPAAVVPAPRQRPPTLDAAERAQVRELLARAPALDAAGAREVQALLFHDAVLRAQALREAGEHGPELAALLAEVRAGLPQRQAAADLPHEVLATAQALLAGDGGPGSASPFAAAR